MMLGNTKKYNMDPKTADKTLQNVFAACDKEPNDKSFEFIRVWSMANAAIAKVGFCIAVGLLLVIFAMPLAFLHTDKEPQEAKNEASSELAGQYIDEEEDCYVLLFEGEGIEYGDIYAKRDDGSTVRPLHVDEEKGIVKFPFIAGNLNIFIPKEDGSVIKTVISK